MSPRFFNAASFGGIFSTPTKTNLLSCPFAQRSKTPAQPVQGHIQASYNTRLAVGN